MVLTAFFCSFWRLCNFLHLPRRTVANRYPPCVHKWVCLFAGSLPVKKKSVFEGWVVGFSVLRRRRQFGLLKVTSEWSLLCSQHSNLIEYAWCITISTVVGSILTNYITLTTWQREYLFDLFLLPYATRKDCLRILFCSVFRKNSQEF